MFLFDFKAFLDSLRKFDNLLDLSLILLVDGLDDFERPVRFAKDAEMSILARLAVLFIHFHAVTRALGTLNVEKDLAVWLVTLDARTHISSFFAANVAELIEAREVHFMNNDGLLGRYSQLLDPHAAAMVGP